MSNSEIYAHGDNNKEIKEDVKAISQMEICSYANKAKSRKSEADNKETRKQKYAFQTRSPVDILDDGYRWRKYGQKTVKNSKFPRSYYKCTHSGCNVKKQIQRNSKDEEIVVTTYEGVHTHPIQRSINFEEILRQMQPYVPYANVDRVHYSPIFASHMQHGMQ